MNKLCRQVVMVLCVVVAVAGEQYAVAGGPPPVTTYTSVSINSATSVYFDPAADSAFDATGAALTLSDSGTHNLAFNNGAGYTIKPTSDNAYAGAALATGQVKTLASLGFGTDLPGSPVPANHSNGSASARVEMADSFTAYSGSTPFLWNNGTTVSFRFDVTGSSTVPNGLTPPPDPATPGNNIYSVMSLHIYTPGTVNLVRQLETFDFNAYPDFNTALDALNALNNEIQARSIGSDYWYFGDSVVPFSIDPAHVVSINPTTPAALQYDFTPNGDFDWLLSLDTSIQLDASLQNTSATIDLSHTITTSYVGPAGATTYSASGLFPDTLPLSQVPEPGTTSILVVGLGGLALCRGRRLNRLLRR
jgi:hypothetical protein